MIMSPLSSSSSNKNENKSRSSLTTGRRCCTTTATTTTRRNTTMKRRQRGVAKNNNTNNNSIALLVPLPLPINASSVIARLELRKRERDEESSRLLQKPSHQIVSSRTNIVKRPRPNASSSLPPKKSKQRLNEESSILQHRFDYDTNINNLSEAPRAYRKPIGFTNKAVTYRIHAGAAQTKCFALSSSSPSDSDDDDGVPIAAVGMDDTPVRVSDHHSSSSQMLQTASHDEIRVNRSLLARPHLLTVANSSSTTSLWLPSPPIDVGSTTLVQDDDEEDLPLMATIRLSRMEPNNHNETQEEEEEEDEEQQQQQQQAPLAFGYFSGETIYRNQVVHSGGELLKDGHVSLANLVLPACSSALVTTFEPPNPEWVDTIFPEYMERLLVIRPDENRTIGDARMDPLFLPKHKKSRRHWHFLSCKPHTGGCLHGKVLLFRSDKGLRVVISGNNFHQYQMENDRDCFWAQDFGVVATTTSTTSSTTRTTLGNHTNTEFGRRLREFLDAMSECRESADQQVVRAMFDALFRGGIDLSEAKARLVYSFPRVKESRDDRGGWMQLVDVIRDLVGLTTEDYDTDDSTQNNIKYGTSRSHSDQEAEDEEGHPLYAMSGSMGNLNPDFLQQMALAFQGVVVETLSSYHGSRVDDDEDVKWEDIDSVRCLMPSRQTIHPIVNGRLMAHSHWESIPEDAKRRIFFDAVPNPTETPLPYHPFSHCKVLYKAQVERMSGAMQQPDKKKKRTAIVYVGSHNFSKAAWGLGGEMPRNTEIGVVLSTTDQTQKRQWEERLPYVLPTADVSPATYVPATAGRGVEQKRINDPNQAATMVRALSIKRG